MKRYLAFLILLIVCYAQSSGENALDICWETEYRAKKIVMCESGGRHNGVWGDLDKPYPAYGIAQFQKRTFDWMKKLAGRPELEWKNKEDQLWLLRFAIKNNLQHHWTCAKEK